MTYRPRIYYTETDKALMWDRWQTVTQLEVCRETLLEPASHCAEFLIHAADVEGLQSGIDEALDTMFIAYCVVSRNFTVGS